MWSIITTCIDERQILMAAETMFSGSSDSGSISRKIDPMQMPVCCSGRQAGEHSRCCRNTRFLLVGDAINTNLQTISDERLILYLHRSRDTGTTTNGRRVQSAEAALRGGGWTKPDCILQPDMFFWGILVSNPYASKYHNHSNHMLLRDECDNGTYVVVQ